MTDKSMLVSHTQVQLLTWGRGCLLGTHSPDHGGNSHVPWLKALIKWQLYARPSASSCSHVVQLSKDGCAHGPHFTDEEIGARRNYISHFPGHLLTKTPLHLHPPISMVKPLTSECAHDSEEDLGWTSSEGSFCCSLVGLAEARVASGPCS